MELAVTLKWNWWQFCIGICNAIQNRKNKSVYILTSFLYTYIERIGTIPNPIADNKAYIKPFISFIVRTQLSSNKYLI